MKDVVQVSLALTAFASGSSVNSPNNCVSLSTGFGEASTLARRRSVVFPNRSVCAHAVTAEIPVCRGRTEHDFRPLGA